MKNQHGLDRHIPKDVREAVRARSKFGCVICGKIPYHYDHVRVEFKDAKVHDPEDIVLLCTEHHGMKTNQQLDADDIELAIAHRSGQDAKFRFKLPILKSSFSTYWGDSIIDAKTAIQVDGEDILSIKTTDNDLEPIMISGVFRDLSSQPLCEIRDNELISRASNVGDFEQIKDRFIYRTPLGNVALAFHLSSKSLKIFEMYHLRHDCFVSVKDDRLLIGNAFHGLRMSKFEATECLVGIEMASKFKNFPHLLFDPSKLMYRNVANNMIIRRATVAVTLE